MQSSRICVRAPEATDFEAPAHPVAGRQRSIKREWKRAGFFSFVQSKEFNRTEEDRVIGRKDFVPTRIHHDVRLDPAISKFFTIWQPERGGFNKYPGPVWGGEG